MTTMFKGRDGKANPKAPGRFQTGSAPRVPQTVQEAMAAGWSGKDIRQAIVSSSPGKHLRIK